MSLESNKELVRKFVNATINERNPEKSATFMGDTYTQHAHGVPDGRDGFLADIHDHFLDPFPNAKLEIQRLIAEDDLVVCHSKLTLNSADPDDRGVALFDMFRVTDDKIVEHWYAATPVPDTDPVNSNTMF